MAITVKQESGGDTNATPDVWHEAFKLDTSPVILRSNDGVLFKVPKSDLVRQGSVFKDMFDVPPADKEERINLDLSGKALEALLSASRNDGVTHPINYLNDATADQFCDFWDFAVKMQVKAADKAAENCLSWHSPGKFWARLLSATKAENLAVVRKILGVMRERNLSESWVWNHIENLASHWREPLLIVLLGSPKGGHRYAYAHDITQIPCYKKPLDLFRSNWAEKFEPLPRGTTLIPARTSIKREASSCDTVHHCSCCSRTGQNVSGSEEGNKRFKK